MRIRRTELNWIEVVNTIEKFRCLSCWCCRDQDIWSEIEKKLFAVVIRK